MRGWSRPVLTRTAFSIASLALVACAPAATDIGDPVTPARAHLDDGPATAMVPLVDGRVLVDGADGLRILADSSIPAIHLAETSELGAITAWTAFEDSTLIAGGDRVVLVRGDELVFVPLRMVLNPDEQVLALAATPRSGNDPELWIATSIGLRVFRNQALVPILIEAHELPSALIAPSGPGAVWVVADGALMRVAIDEDDSVQATEYRKATAITSLASDSRGVPWMIIDHALHALEADGTLVRFELDDALTAIRASGSSPDVWAIGESGVWHAMRRTARRVRGISRDSVVLPGNDGDVFVSNDDGVDRFRARHHATLEGLPEDGRVFERIEVRLVLENGEGAHISAQLDRRPLDVDSHLISIDPSMFATGEHRIDILITWSDGTLPRSIVRQFSVAHAVTWTDQIRTIYVEHCADCHGAAGPSPTRLDTRQEWEDRIERILENVTTGRMPLGRAPLSDDAIAMIRTWSMTGFAE